MSLLLCCAASGAAWAEEEPVIPPSVVKRVEATMPVGAAPPRQDHVLLEFTVGTDGRVSDVLVVESAGPAWDSAARDAMLRWVFSPALHHGAPVAVRTRLSFDMPDVALDAGAAAAGGDAGVAVGGDSDAAPEDGGAAGWPAGAADADGGAAETRSEAGALASPAPVDAGHRFHEMSTTVLGRSMPKSRGATDFVVEVGELEVVPRRTAGELLKLAPGFLLTNEGGEGHPEQIYLRGFDAREGQDLELTVDGVPINDSGNLHGNGYADLNFLIPELVQNLHVTEGPFSPRQGNYAVAGSADYQLGLEQRGLLAQATYGSFDTQRLLLLWGPPGESTRTFGGVQLGRTAGFGQNREAQNAKLAAQYEGQLSDHVSFRTGVLGYAGTWRSAGLLRQDDVLAGRRGFYDTNDARQGGDSTRAQLHADLHGHGGAFTWDTQAFVVARSTRVLENFTGFLHDAQLPQQTPHAQRGDLIDRDSSAFTVGARASSRYRTKWWDRNQDLEAGFYGRFDAARGVQVRVEDGTNVPYLRDYDLDSRLTDLGAFVDLSLSPVWWLAVRGGLRAENFTYNVHDLCAVREVRRPSQTNPPGDASCLSQRDFGRYREPDERNATQASAFLPRASVHVGPFRGLTLSASAGTGIRSIDPQFVTENLKTPFASIFAWESGAEWSRSFEPVSVTARGAVFGTRVDKDVIFNEQEGRGTIGGGTSRLGTLAAVRARGGFFDASANVTWVQSKFDDTGLLVPYVPDLVARADAAVFRALPWKPGGRALDGRAGLGVTYVGRRALPYGQRSDVIFVVDASGELAWRGFVLNLQVTNLLDAQYRLGEYRFASDFRTNGALPTLVPVRHFSAGPPRTVLLSLGVRLGGDA